MNKQERLSESCAERPTDCAQRCAAPVQETPCRDFAIARADRNQQISSNNFCLKSLFMWAYSQKSANVDFLRKLCLSPY
jgi:hypothetical protein